MSVDVLCVSTQLEEREKSPGNFRGKEKSKREMLCECAISFCHKRFHGESLMVFLRLLVVIPNQAEHLNCLSSFST